MPTPLKPGAETTIVPSKAEMVQTYLRDKIMSFELAPGELIDKLVICQQLGVSRQPVTVALRELVREGLVEVLPQRGSYVMRLDGAFIIDRMVVRSGLEADSVRRLARTRDTAMIARLRDCLAQQRAAVHDAGWDELARLDIAFHDALSEMAQSARLAEEIHASLSSLRRVYALQPATGADTTLMLADHMAIVDAIEAGDAGAATLAVFDHADGFQSWFGKLRHDHPDLFVRSALPIAS